MDIQLERKLVFGQVKTARLLTGNRFNDFWIYQVHKFRVWKRCTLGQVFNINL